MLGTEGQGDSFDAIYNYPICIVTEAERRQCCPNYLSRENEERIQREWDLWMEEWIADLVAGMVDGDASPMSDEDWDESVRSLTDGMPLAPKRGEWS